MNTHTDIAIYGGAFTPPTIGHRAIVDALLGSEGIARVIIAPSGPRSDKIYALESDIRRRLIEVFIAEFDDPRVEWDFSFFSGTADTTTLGMDSIYRERFGGSPYQVFGADVSHTMATWPNSPENRLYLLEDMPKIFFSRPWVELDLWDKWSYKVIHASIPDASSTLVRESRRLDLLTAKVREEYEKILPKV